MIIFRTDASQELGFGHLVRCMTLTRAMGDTEILFCLGDKNKDAIKFLKRNYLAHCTIDDIAGLDLPEVQRIIFDLPSALITEPEILQFAKEKECKILSLNNLQKDPNLIILRPEFKRYHEKERKYRKKIENIFVGLGGGIKADRILEVIQEIKQSRDNFKITIAPGFCIQKRDVTEIKKEYPGIRIISGNGSIAKALYETDLAIVRPGVMAYESAAIGTPALYLYDNDNEMKRAFLFEKMGLGFLALNTLSFQYFSQKKRIEMGKRGKEMIDCKGIDRIITHLKSEGILHG